MHTNASVLVGSTNLMTLFHPFAGSAGPFYKGKPVGGVPIMIDIDTGEVIVFDPWLLKEAGIIKSLYGIILGPIGHGKSSLAKIIAHRLGWIMAGYDMVRCLFNDYKPEAGDTEYGKLSQRMFSTPYRIAHMKVNIFEPQLYTAADGTINTRGLLRMAEILTEFSNKGPLIGDNAEALRMGVALMLQSDSSLWEPGLLSNKLRSFTDDQITAYNNRLRDELLESMRSNANRIENDELRDIVQGQIAIVESSVDNTNYDDMKRAGKYVSTLIQSITHSSIGGMFGNEHSLYAMLTQRAATLDWREVSMEAETLMRTILAEIKVNAIETHRLDLLPHLEIDDEKHKPMGNITYARTIAYLGEIARAVHTCNLSATHRFSSIRKGGVGSELWQLGDTIINNLGFVLIGRHENDPGALDELRQRFNLTSSDVYRIANLPPYVFAIKLGENQPIRYGRVFALPDEMEFLQTNAANDRMVDRPELVSPEDLARFAQLHGIRYIGFDQIAA